MIWNGVGSRGAAESHLETYGGPLRFARNNAPSKQMILGTVRLPILAGNKRYAHITTLRSDKVLPGLFGIEGLGSEDSVRRAFTHASNEELTLWLDRCMNTVFEPLLSEPWVLGLHATVKTLYGKQVEARIGYNPMNPGRPSQVYHAYCIARLRMLLNVDVQAGNQVASACACGAVGLVGLAAAGAVAGDIAR